MSKSKVDSIEEDLFQSPSSVEFPHLLNVFSQSALCFTSAVNVFVRRYFACVPISNDLLDEIVIYCDDKSDGQRLINDVIASPVWIRYPEKRKSHSKVLKELLSKLELSSTMEIYDGLYEAIARSMDTSSEYGHRIYLSASGHRYIVLKERNEQLSLGTTGLSCWQASCDLAHYLLSVGANFIRDRNVVELGAGCGFCGIALAASGLAKSVTLTDCNKHVLDLLEENLHNNFSQEMRLQKNIAVSYFDWTTSRPNDLHIEPDFIVASDVVYDSAIVAALAHTIANLIEAGGRTNVRCLIAGTVRNEETMQAFFSATEANGLKLDERFTFSDGVFRFEDGRRIIQESLFPFAAAIQSPTTFHWFSSI